MIEMRADRLPNLGEQLEFFGPALSLVHDHVVLEGQCNLQSEPDQQAQIRRAEHAPLSVREEEDAEIMFPSLQAHRHQVGDSLRQQRLLADLELSSGKHR